MYNVALIKTTPDKFSKIKPIIENEKNIIIISSTKYIKWEMDKLGIKSRLFSPLSPIKSIEQLHRDLDKKYNTLCHNTTTGYQLNYADLLQVHLCWEIQKEYYFLATLQRWLHKFKIKKLYYEYIPLKNKKRYAANINQLMREYCAERKITFEKI